MEIFKNITEGNGYGTTENVNIVQRDSSHLIVTCAAVLHFPYGSINMKCERFSYPKFYSKLVALPQVSEVTVTRSWINNYLEDAHIHREYCLYLFSQPVEWALLVVLEVVYGGIHGTPGHLLPGNKTRDTTNCSGKLQRMLLMCLEQPSHAP